jgi:IPT/TIG domain
MKPTSQLTSPILSVVLLAVSCLWGCTRPVETPLSPQSAGSPKIPPIPSVTLSSASGRLAGGENVTIDSNNLFIAQTLDRRPLGIGLAGIKYYSAQLPFLDQFKSSRPWLSQQEGREWAKGDPLDVDDRGWVRSLKPGQTADRNFLTLEGTLPFTRYVVRYEGSGKVTYHFKARKDEAASGPNRDVITLDPNTERPAILRIESTDPNNYIRNITIVPEQFVGEFDRGEIFNPLLLDILKNFRALRFMDWMQTNHSEQIDWSNRPQVEDLTYAEQGVPVEIMVQLANRLQADPWFNMPHQATPEYMEAFATYVRDHLNPQLKIYIEHSNEVWNGTFPQHEYAKEQARQRWKNSSDDGYMQWHGMRTAQMCESWKRVFAGQTDRVHCTLGTQRNFQGLEQAGLNCPLWVAEGNKACYQHQLDSIAITTYFSGCVNGRKPEDRDRTRTWFQEPDRGLTKGMEQIASAAHFPCNDTTTNQNFEYYKKVADDYNLELVAYEGGQHITANGMAMQNDPDFIQFHIGLNRDRRMFDRYQEMLQTWKTGGGTLLMHFMDVSTPNEHGSWGALEYLTQGSSPKYDALLDFNAKTPCWWDGCDRPLTPTPSASTAPQIAVTIGNKPCQTLKRVSNSQLTCQTPASDQLGPVDVTITVDRQTISLPQAFTYR